MTEHPAAPTTEAGRVLLSSFDQFSEASGTDFPWLRESILAIEAEARSTPAEALDPLRSALERLLAVAMTEEEDVSAATQDEWIAAIKQANEVLGERAFANPCLYCGTDEYDVPYEDTEEHRNTSEHQITVYNS